MNVSKFDGSVDELGRMVWRMGQKFWRLYADELVPARRAARIRRLGVVGSGGDRDAGCCA